MLHLISKVVFCTNAMVPIGSCSWFPHAIHLPCLKELTVSNWSFNGQGGQAFSFFYTEQHSTVKKIPTETSKLSSPLTLSLLFYLQFCPSVCQCLCVLPCTHVSHWCYILLCQWLWKLQWMEQKPSWIYKKTKQNKKTEPKTPNNINWETLPWHEPVGRSVKIML